MPVDKFGKMSDTKTMDTGVSLTYIYNNYIHSDGGTPISGSINMNGNTLYNASDLVNPQDVATKEYADKVGGGEVAIVKTRGGNYSALGNIDMRGYILTNVLDPAEAQDVATKEYVDRAKKYVEAVKSNEFHHLIASYSGPLIYNGHQFTFGGYELYSPITGFLVPQSGRIRKIKMKTPINKESLGDRLIERDRVDINFAYYGFFSFIRI